MGKGGRGVAGQRGPVTGKGRDSLLNRTRRGLRFINGWKDVQTVDTAVQVFVMPDDALPNRSVVALFAELEIATNTLLKQESKERFMIRRLENMAGRVDHCRSDRDGLTRAGIEKSCCEELEGLYKLARYERAKLQGTLDRKDEMALCKRLNTVGLADWSRGLYASRNQISSEQDAAFARITKQIEASMTRIKREETTRVQTEALLLEETREREKLSSEIMFTFGQTLEECDSLVRNLFKPPVGLLPLKDLPIINRSVGSHHCFRCPHHYVGGHYSDGMPFGVDGNPSWFSVHKAGKVAYQTNLLEMPWMKLFPGDMLYSIVGDERSSYHFVNGDCNLLNTTGVMNEERSMRVEFIGTFRIRGAPFGSPLYIQLAVVHGEHAYCDPVDYFLTCDGPLKIVKRILTSDDATVYRDTIGPFKARIRSAFDIVSRKCPPVLVSALNDFKLSCLEGRIECEPGLVLRCLTRSYLRVHPEGWPGEIA